MKKFFLIILACFLAFSSMHQVMSLKCRVGNQQSDDQFQKIMQVCRRRFLGYDRDNGRDYNARDTDSQESSDSDSDEDMFDNKFLSSGGNRYNGKNGDKLGSGSSSRYDYTGSSSPLSRNSTRQSSRSSSNRSSNGNRSYYDNGQMNSKRRSLRRNGMNSRDGYGDNYSNNRYNSNNMNRNNNDNNDDNYNSDGDREQACVTQCFFNELNLVDQRGFPERSAVIGIMTQNIQDPELRDFVEESVIECYHYLNNNGRQEKCQFSQNLLSCLAEKGSERCEDWDDE